MPTLTIRKVPVRVLRELKSIARQNSRSMEQEVREVLAQYTADRLSVIEQIEAAWARQGRRPDPGEIEEWLRAGRE